MKALEALPLLNAPQVSKKDHSLLLVFLYIPVSIDRSFSSVLTAFVLHMWKECSRRVYFIKFRQWYINVSKKAEKEGKREKKRERKKDRRKNVNLAYLAEHLISIFLSTDFFRILEFCFETMRFVLRLKLRE